MSAIVSRRASSYRPKTGDEDRYHALRNQVVRLTAIGFEAVHADQADAVLRLSNTSEQDSRRRVYAACSRGIAMYAVFTYIEVHVTRRAFVVDACGSVTKRELDERPSYCGGTIQIPGAFRNEARAEDLRH